MTGLSGRWALVLVAALIVVALPGCGGQGSSPQETPAPSTQGSQPPDTGAVGSEGALDGEALARQKCTMCHTYDRIEQVKFSEAEWESKIQKMESLGLSVTAEERAAIKAYLVERDN